MRINNHYKTISFVLVFLSVLSFFIGFIYGENSAGAGTFSGDFVDLWKNLQSFLNNDLKTAIKLSSKFLNPINKYSICDFGAGNGELCKLLTKK